MKMRIAFSLVAIASLVVPVFSFAQGSVSGSSGVGVGVVPPATIIVPSASVGPAIRICPYDNVTLRPGASGSDVKTLQSLLAQDSAVYPQGLTTGYYGALTQDAVKKLQLKFGLSVTGVIDEDTRPVIFPCVTLHVVSPNGGEAWKTGETHEITWDVNAPIYMQGADKSLRSVDVAPGTVVSPQTPGTVFPFYPNLSIDLIMRTDIAVMNPLGEVGIYHIGSASLYGERSFSWTIPQTIPESKFYKVRISVWKDLPQPTPCDKFERPCPLSGGVDYPYPVLWRGFLWDESDAEFAILGGVQPIPSPTPPPPDYSKLLVLRQQVVDMISQLQRMLQLIDDMLGNTGVTPRPLSH